MSVGEAGVVDELPEDARECYVALTLMRRINPDVLPEDLTRLVEVWEPLLGPVPARSDPDLDEIFFRSRDEPAHPPAALSDDGWWDWFSGQISAEPDDRLRPSQEDRSTALLHEVFEQAKKTTQPASQRSWRRRQKRRQPSSSARFCAASPIWREMCKMRIDPQSSTLYLR